MCAILPQCTAQRKCTSFSSLKNICKPFVEKELKTTEWNIQFVLVCTADCVILKWQFDCLCRAHILHHFSVLQKQYIIKINIQYGIVTQLTLPCIKYKAEREESAESSPSLSVGGDISARQYGHAWRTTSLVSVGTRQKHGLTTLLLNKNDSKAILLPVYTLKG